MSYLLEILGRGLLAELASAFRDVLPDDPHHSDAELRDAATANPGDAALATRYGVRCLNQRDYTAARRIFEAALIARPYDLPALVGLACVNDEIGRIDESIEHLETAHAVASQDPTVMFAQGFCYEKRGDVDRAFSCYEQCQKVAPNLRNAHERLAALHLKMDDIDSAIAEYEQICWHEPGEAVPLLTLANLFLQAGRYREAIQRYQTVLTIEPDNWEARDDLVAAYEEAGLVHEAIQELHRLMSDQPDFADNHLRLGDLYGKLGKEDQALVEYKMAVDMSPDYLEAVVKVGTTHLRRGEHEDAALWFNRSVEINDRLLTAYVGLGIAQHELGQHDEALASLEMASNVEPNSTLLFSETARLHLKMGVQKQSDRYLSPQKIAQLDSLPAAGAAEDLIDCQIDRLRAMLRERPNYADLHYRLGLLLKHRGNLDEAVECFEQATAINPNYSKALIQLGLSLQSLGRSDEASDILHQALAADPGSVELHYQLGLIFADRHQFALAVEQFEEAMRGDCHRIEFHANLALALQNMGLIDRANATWQTLCDLAEESTAGRNILERAKGATESQ